MQFKLPLARSQEINTINVYSIVSVSFAIISIYLFFSGIQHWPLFLQKLPSYLVNGLFFILFINAGYAIIRPGIAKPDEIGMLIIDDQENLLRIEEDLQIIKLSFSEINRIEFEIKGCKNLMDNYQGNHNYIEITYDLFMSKKRLEFVLDTAGEMYTIKSAFNKIVKANPKIEISFYS